MNSSGQGVRLTPYRVCGFGSVRWTIGWAGSASVSRGSKRWLGASSAVRPAGRGRMVRPWWSSAARPQLRACIGRGSQSGHIGSDGLCCRPAGVLDVRLDRLVLGDLGAHPMADADWAELGRDVARLHQVGSRSSASGRRTISGSFLNATPGAPTPTDTCSSPNTGSSATWTNRMRSRR